MQPETLPCAAHRTARRAASHRYRGDSFMLEQKLIVGRFFDLPPIVTTPVYVGPAVNFFHEVTSVIRHLNESTKTSFFGPKSSTTGMGAHASKAHRNFVWLPWEKGFVTEVQLAGVDVLTGPMSGCWISRYTKNGNTYVGHVGTDVNSQANTTQAKDAWNQFAAGKNGITGFNPSNHWALNPVPSTGNDGGFCIYGLITAAGSFYSVFTYEQGKVGHSNNFRIAGIRLEQDALPLNGQIP